MQPTPMGFSGAIGTAFRSRPRQFGRSRRPRGYGETSDSSSRLGYALKTLRPRSDQGPMADTRTSPAACPDRRSALHWEPTGGDTAPYGLRTGCLWRRVSQISPPRPPKVVRNRVEAVQQLSMPELGGSSPNPRAPDCGCAGRSTVYEHPGVVEGRHTETSRPEPRIEVGTSYTRSGSDPP